MEAGLGSPGGQGCHGLTEGLSPTFSCSQTWCWPQEKSEWWPVPGRGEDLEKRIASPDGTSRASSNKL